MASDTDRGDADRRHRRRPHRSISAAVAAARPPRQADITLTDTRRSTGGPARYVRVSETGGQLGFITPMTHNFCEPAIACASPAPARLHTCLGQEDACRSAPAAARLRRRRAAQRGHRSRHRPQAEGPRLHHRPPPQPPQRQPPHERHLAAEFPTAIGQFPDRLISRQVANFQLTPSQRGWNGRLAASC